MKKFYIALFFSVFAYTGSAQNPIVLTYNSHSIKNEVNNEMRICNYADPGAGGEQVIWDFSQIKVVKDFTGFVKSSYQTVNSDVFPQADTELEEFNNLFYFKTDENRTEQYGYASKNNSVVVHFEKPFLKMVFPFTYGDGKTGDFHGTIQVGQKTGNIEGTYLISADGYGKLILPGNYVIANTLRVKTVKDYSQTIEGNEQHFTITTYRWYTHSHRYPVLVLTDIVGNNGSKTFQAAFNTSFNGYSGLDVTGTVEDKGFFVMPNPVEDQFTLSFSLPDEADVLFEIFDISGRKTGEILSGRFASGNYTREVKSAEAGLHKGTYLIKATIGNNVYATEIIVGK